MKKSVILILFVISIGAFASFIDKQSTEDLLIEQMMQDTSKIEDSIRFESPKDSVQYSKNKKLDQKLDELKEQQIMLDSLIKTKSQNN